MYSDGSHKLLERHKEHQTNYCQLAEEHTFAKNILVTVVFGGRMREEKGRMREEKMTVVNNEYSRDVHTFVPVRWSLSKSIEITHLMTLKIREY